MKNVERMLKDIEVLRSNWNEVSQFKIKGVGNLSVADLDVLEMYGESLIHGGPRLMKPLGSIKEVLEAYDIVYPEW